MSQYLLNISKHDFAEIAYIVCKHAVPADAANPVNTPERVLERLRNAEKQFRQHSILVAFDSESLELFTFYRKIDVLKDQRTILNKFGYVCRLNSCTVSAKNPARMSDLLKPENHRIYRLFTSAILSSLQIQSKPGERVVSVGSNTYLLSGNGITRPRIGSADLSSSEWKLHRIDILVVATGQLILTVQTANSPGLYRISDPEDLHNMNHPSVGSMLYLAPIGQIGRFSGGLVATPSEIQQTVSLAGKVVGDEMRNAHTKILAATTWLTRKYQSTTESLSRDTPWVEVNVAVFEASDALTPAIGEAVSWKSLMWPSTLTFVFNTATSSKLPDEKTATESDPLKFVSEWFSNSAERNGLLSRAQAVKDHKDEADNDHLFSDDAPFEDNYHSHPFGPLMTATNQLVYPTPPEGGIAHPTPGLSSIDGVAPTPAPLIGLHQSDAESFLDQEMPDAAELQPGRVGTGFYDEDLFEEMPDDNFGPNADAGEPNWDFFDEQDPENPDTIADSSGARDGVLEPDQNVLDTNPHGPNHQLIEVPPSPNLKTVDQSRVDNNTEFPNSDPTEIENIYASDLTMSPTIIQQYEYVGKSAPPPSGRVSLSMENQENQYGPQSVSPQRSRRRSSVFDSIHVDTRSKNHDSRYDKHGKFWFDESNQLSTKQAAPKTTHAVRPASSGSDTSMTSGTSESDASLPIENPRPAVLRRTWTEYKPETPIRMNTETADSDTERGELEFEKLLDVLDAAPSEEPFTVGLPDLYEPRHRPVYNEKKNFMVAQLLVDQMSQSSLLQREMQLHQKCNTSLIDVSMDHSGARLPVGRATLAELASVSSRSTNRVVRIDSRRLCIGRSDTEITSKQSILPFWDTLGLQPYSKAKDVTAFCLYPDSDNIADGCLYFLKRLADTYATCNLGNHSAGYLVGLTDDGLIAWTRQPGSGFSLKQLCQKLGSAIAGQSTLAEKTVVVHMISDKADALQYREMCYAFTILFDAYVGASEGTRKEAELVLQIVPVSFVAAPDTLVIPEQQAYLQLALEVYNRVPMRQLYNIPAASASAAILDKNQVREPVFELNSVVASPLARDGMCLHLAYSFSPDKRWLTAAWTDEQGLAALTMSYCLRTAISGKSRPKREIFRSIWDISLDIMSRSRERWRFVVGHAGPFETEDVSEWQQLANMSNEERKSTPKFIFISVDLDSEIVVEAKNLSIKLSQQSTVTHGPNVAGTPVSTPQAHVTSPDQLVVATPTSGSVQHSSAATPPDHSIESATDNDVVLMDPADQSWGVILSFGLNQSPDYRDVRTAEASGLLIRRTGSREEGQTLRTLGINLIATSSSPATPSSHMERESTIQEIIEQYRGLVTLAISRGCIDRSFDCVPWHIATAVKGARALGTAM